MIVIRQHVPGKDGFAALVQRLQQLGLEAGHPDWGTADDMLMLVTSSGHQVQPRIPHIVRRTVPGTPLPFAVVEYRGTLRVASFDASDTSRDPRSK